MAYPTGNSADRMRRGAAALLVGLVMFASMVGQTVAQSRNPSVGGRRVALVIGMSRYQFIPALDNPKNDARLMADTLRGLGFTLIGGGPQLDLDKPGFDRAVQAFGQQLPGAQVALFYYAGHGLQVRGTNWLVPITANPTRETDVDFQMVDAGLVLHQMEGAGTKLNVMILDACRNNPFGGRGLRAATGGLAQMQAPEGTLISYATQPGNVAADGADGDSPFTKALTQTMKRPGLDVFRLFNDVGLQVKRLTAGNQQPWVSSSPIEGEFYFAGNGGGGVLPAPSQPAAAPVASTPSAGGGDAELVFWQTIANSGNPADFEEYLRQYPNGRFAGLAHTRAEPRSAAPQLAVAAPPPLASATAGDAFSRGKAAYERKDYVDAMRLFRAAADAGDAGGMAGVGALYGLGLGVPANDNEATRWIKNAAVAGDGWVADIRGMLAAGDPHAAYLTEAEYQKQTVTNRGEFAGLGIEITLADGRPKVVSPIDDAPAARAGLKPGDILLRIDGTPTDGLSLEDVVSRLRGAAGSAVKLTVLRAGRDPFDVSVVRAVIRVNAVKSHLEAGRIGYLRITQFTEQAEQQTRDAIEELTRQAGGRLDGLILDLRNDPGGLFKQAVAVAGDFLDGGAVVKLAGWAGRPVANDQSFTAPANGDKLRGVPLVVLINGATASGAEIVTGALQDRRRARVVGTRSFGKGTVQTIYALDGHGALRLTTAEYLLPSGRSIQALGITPDEVVLPTPDQQSAGGPQSEAQLRGVSTGAAAEPTLDIALIGTDRDHQLGIAAQELRELAAQQSGRH
jgi:C-terminal peptidase prc